VHAHSVKEGGQTGGTAHVMNNRKISVAVESGSFTCPFGVCLGIFPE
jgi:hypothetical protein